MSTGGVGATSPTRNVRLLGLAAALCAAVLAVIGFAGAASAEDAPNPPAGAATTDGVEPVFYDIPDGSGQPTCADLFPDRPGIKDFRYQPVVDGSGGDGTLSVTLDVYEGAYGPEFNWTSNIGVEAIFAKGGPDGDIYIYKPPSADTADGGLHAPVNPQNGKYFGLSHVDFCYGSGGGTKDPGTVAGAKYYDADADGEFDPGEVGIEGWPINVSDGSMLTTGADGTFSGSFDEGTYDFAEGAASPPWIQTGNPVDQTVATGGASATLNADKTYTVDVVDESSATGLFFGNICVGGGGGHTLGFWSNKNGQALISAGDIAALVALNLREANGGHFNPANAAAVKNWLLKATATNMSYMLSAQLTAMKLSVLEGFVDGDALIQAPGASSANANGFATVNAVMLEADTELGLHGLTPSDAAWRSYQEALKNALDAANNNLNFVQPGPGSCPAPVFPY